MKLRWRLYTMKWCGAMERNELIMSILCYIFFFGGKMLCIFYLFIFNSIYACAGGSLQHTNQNCINSFIRFGLVRRARMHINNWNTIKSNAKISACNKWKLLCKWSCNHGWITVYGWLWIESNRIAYIFRVIIIIVSWLQRVCTQNAHISWIWISIKCILNIDNIF